MRIRLLSSVVVVLLCAVPLGADVTLIQTVSIEGGMSALAGGVMPRMTTRIKGLKARADVEVMDQTMTTITDLATRQVILLNQAQQTAHVLGAGGATLPGMPPTPPKVDVTFKPTGQSRVIEGATCDEHVFSMSMDMGQMAAGRGPSPDAESMMKDVRMVMDGSIWVSASGPGTADYAAFQKAAADSNLMVALGGLMPGQQSAGADKLLAAAAMAPGLPYLTEMTMRFEGSGKMAEMMNKMGPMKMTQRITSVSTDTIPDDMFKVPDGYRLTKP